MDEPLCRASALWEGIRRVGERVNGWRGEIGMAFELGIAASCPRAGAFLRPRIAQPEAGPKDRGGCSVESGPAREGG